MTILNFEQQTDSTILKRGKEYFRKGYVKGLEEDEPGSWSAEVKGTELYSVSVELRGSSITGWACDCPYDFGPMCKHVVAVLYAIADNQERNSGTEPKEKETKQKKISTDQLLKELSKEDLVKFLAARFKSDKTLRHFFLAEFAHLAEKDIHKTYYMLIQNIRSAARGRDGFIDYHAAQKMTDSLLNLAEKARTLLHQKNIEESLAICKALLEEAPAIIEIIDESDGGIYQVVEETLELFGEIAAQAPPLRRDDIFSYLIDAYPDERYRLIGADAWILRLLSSLVTGAEQEQELFKLIDAQIAKLQQNDSSHHRIADLVETKITYLQSRKRHAEVQPLLEQHKHVTRFRELLIRGAIEQQQYDVAKTLCLEGIAQAKKDYAPGHTHRWKSILLEIAVLQQQKDDIRSLAEDLFFDGHGNMEYYRHIRSTYTKKGWPDIYNQLIAKITGSRSYFDKKTVLAGIYIEEGKLADLLKLVQRNADNIEFVDRYARYLHSNYSARLLACYEQGLSVYMQQIGRTYYENAVVYLRKMQELPGGIDRVREIVDNLCEQYKQRRAMIEIFDKAFP